MVNKFSIFFRLLIFLIYGCGENVSDKKEYAEFIKGSWIFVKSDDPALDSCFNYFILFKDSSFITTYTSIKHKIIENRILFDQQSRFFYNKQSNFIITDSINHKSSFLIDSIDSLRMIFKNKLGYKYYFKNLDNEVNINRYKKIISCEFKVYACPDCSDTTNLVSHYLIRRDLVFMSILDSKKIKKDSEYEKYASNIIIRERVISQYDFLRYENIINHYLSNEILDNNCSYGRLNIIPRIELNLIFDDKSDTTIIIRNIGNNPIKSGIIVYLDEINPFR